MKKVLIALVAVVAVFLIYVSTRPATFHIERSTTVQAPPAVVFNEVNSLKGFTTWSPWEKLDPTMQKTFGGPDTGVGGTYEWQGNKDVGRGKMKILESTPNERVKYDLEFIEPFASRAVVTMSVAPADAGSKVTWAMDGDNAFVSKLMGVFMDMDAMIGKDFSEGLANLKAIAETKAKASAVQ